MDKNLVNHQIILMRKDVKASKRQTSQKFNQAIKKMKSKLEKLALKLEKSDDKESVEKDMKRLTSKMANKCKDLEELKKLNCDTVSKQALSHDQSHFKDILSKTPNSMEDRLIAHCCLEPNIKKAVEKFKTENPDSDQWLPVQLEMWETKRKKKEAAKTMNKDKDGDSENDKEEDKEDGESAMEEGNDEEEGLQEDEEAEEEEEEEDEEAKGKEEEDEEDKECEEDTEVQEKSKKVEPKKTAKKPLKTSKPSSKLEKKISSKSRLEEIEVKPTKSRQLNEELTKNSMGVAIRLNISTLDEDIDKLVIAKQTEGQSSKRKPKSSFFLDDDGQALPDDDNDVNHNDNTIHNDREFDNNSGRNNHRQGFQQRGNEQRFSGNRMNRAERRQGLRSDKGSGKDFGGQPKFQKGSKMGFNDRSGRFNDRSKGFGGRSGFVAPPPPPSGSNNDHSDGEKLHPSWAAKMALKSKLQKIDLSGKTGENKRIKF